MRLVNLKYDHKSPKTAIVRIEAYNKELSKEDFESNFLVQDAVLRNIILIGEAAKNIPEDFKQNVLQRDLPQLKLTFSKLLNQ